MQTATSAISNENNEHHNLLELASEAETRVTQAAFDISDPIRRSFLRYLRRLYRE
jgi:hypothetical protein